MNHLVGSTSPYLLQHAGNPVDWYPFGDQAFARAHELDRPVLISIGYSACHWCHVMAHESFEDDAIAEVLNEHFVAIKVDREERPDVDAIYMEAVQALFGHGGWPLNAFTTPDGQPFYGGTYYPPVDRPGMPAFRTVLFSVLDVWTEKRDIVMGQARELTDTVASRPRIVSDPQETVPAGEVLVDAALERFRAMFDAEGGGIGDAPKFPQAPMLELLVRAHDLGRPDVLPMLETTLSAMASGGMYDQIGGGFCRYSVDRFWQVPHFEKMLYDQAMLVRTYLHVWQITCDERWRQIVDETLDYVLRDLADPSGGICSSEDADSEDEEGRFYVFSRAEIDAICGPEIGAKAADWYGVTTDGNFEHGTTVLHRSIRGDLIRPSDIAQARRQLFAARENRVRPAKDDKIITEWNAMIGVAFCETADATGDDRYENAARSIATFVTSHLRRPDGRWLRTFRQGSVGNLAVATDYAWLADLFLHLLTTTGEAKWLDEAIRTAQDLDRLFSAEDGGLYTTGVDAESLVVRPRESYDSVTPSAVAVATGAFMRLSALTGDDHFAQRARKLVSSTTIALKQSPIAFPTLVNATLLVDRPPIEVVIAGNRSDLVGTAKQRYLPGAVVLWGEKSDLDLWQNRRDGFAYVCRFGECLSPVDNEHGLADALTAALR